jgi:hypothetical protein
VAQCSIDIDTFVGEQPVHLFDGMFGDQAAGQGQSLTDGVDREGRRPDDAECGVGERQHALGVQVAVKQAADKTAYVLEAKGPVRCHRSPRESCCLRREAPSAGMWQPNYDRRKIANPVSAPRVFSASHRATFESFVTRRRSRRYEGMHEPLPCTAVDWDTSQADDFRGRKREFFGVSEGELTYGPYLSSRRLSKRMPSA